MCKEAVSLMGCNMCGWLVHLSSGLDVWASSVRQCWKLWLIFAQWLRVTPLRYEADAVGAFLCSTEEVKKKGLCVIVSRVSGSALWQPAGSICLSCLPPLSRCCLPQTPELIKPKERLMRCTSYTEQTHREEHSSDVRFCSDLKTHIF